MNRNIMRWIALFLFALLFATCSASMIYGKGHRVSYSSGGCREQAMNDTLNWTLAIGAEWKAQRKTYTWMDLQNEVALRMKLQRKNPWQ